MAKEGFSKLALEKWKTPDSRLISYFRGDSRNARKEMNSKGYNEFYAVMDAVHELIRLLAADAKTDSTSVKMLLVPQVINFPKYLFEYSYGIYATNPGNPANAVNRDAWLALKERLEDHGLEGLAHLINDTWRIFFEIVGCRCADAGQKGTDKMCYQFEQFFLESIKLGGKRKMEGKAKSAYTNFCDVMLSQLMNYYVGGICKRQGEHPKDDAQHIGNLVGIYNYMLKSQDLGDCAASFYRHAGNKLKQAIDGYWDYSPKSNKEAATQFARHKIARTIAIYHGKHPDSIDKPKAGVKDCFASLTDLYKVEPETYGTAISRPDIVKVCSGVEKKRERSGECRSNEGVLNELLKDMVTALEKLANLSKMSDSASSLQFFRGKLSATAQKISGGNKDGNTNPIPQETQTIVKTN